MGKFTEITPVSLRVARKKDKNPDKFTFCRTWTPPRTVIHLSAGQMALVIVTYTVSNSERTAEDLLIGLPILQHLGIDSKSLLEERSDQLDGSDCFNLGDSKSMARSGQVSG